MRYAFWRSRVRRIRAPAVSSSGIGVRRATRISKSSSEEQDSEPATEDEVSRWASPRLPRGDEMLDARELVVEVAELHSLIILRFFIAVRFAGGDTKPSRVRFEE
jgi:hypothetical protein